MNEKKTTSAVTLASGLSLMKEVIRLGETSEQRDLTVEAKYNAARARLANNLIKQGAPK